MGEPPKGRAAEVSGIIRDSGRIFTESHCVFSSAALAYFALIALIPFFILTASVLGYVLGGEDTSATARITATEFSSPFIPLLEGDVEQRLDELVATRRITGVVGLLLLFPAAALFFMTLERALSQIFPVSAARSYWHGRGLALGLVPALIILIAALHYGFLLISPITGVITPQVFVDSILFEWAMPVGMLGVEFVVVVYWFEGKAIPFRLLLVGTGVFCSLWIVARIAFTFYLERLTDFSVVYGSLGGLAAVVVWVHYVALAFLAACSVTEALRLRHVAAVEADAGHGAD